MLPLGFVAGVEGQGVVGVCHHKTESNNYTSLGQGEESEKVNRLYLILKQGFTCAYQRRLYTSYINIGTLKVISLGFSYG